ncbi:MAG: DUF4197 domain-containing protein [Lysobacterales bacterium]|jgi:hypothetical protein
MSNQLGLNTRPGSARVSAALLVMALAGFVANAQAGGWLDKLRDKIAGGQETEQSPGPAEIGSGLKEALRVGTKRVVEQLGVTGGFALDPQIHIPLPGKLVKVKGVLAKVGMDSVMADLEARLNRAAEIATPKARRLFLAAIDDMTLEDVMGIYKGPDDAATQYFREKMSGQLALEMKPVVEQGLADSGAVKTYENAMARYNALPLVPKVEADLSDYVVQEGMDGIFYYLAQEEAAIRRDPVKRTTKLLQRVFGN